MNPLKLRRRRAFVMRVQGHTYKEVGARLGVSESTAQNDVQWIERELERLGRLRPLWPEHDGP